MDPIATYSETRFSGKREFELYPDTIRVRGKVLLKSDFDASIPLESLNPDYTLLRIREPLFAFGVWLIIVSVLITGILVAGFKLAPDHLLVVLVAIQPMAGIALCVATFRKVEFFRFHNDSSVVVLDVARAGKDKHRFDDFVGTLATTIRRSRQVTEPDAAPSRSEDETSREL